MTCRHTAQLKDHAQCSWHAARHCRDDAGIGSPQHKLQLQLVVLRTSATRSKQLVLSAWNNLQCKQALKITKAARGLPLWKPMGCCKALSRRASSSSRLNCMNSDEDGCSAPAPVEVCNKHSFLVLLMFFLLTPTCSSICRTSCV